jgi:hypothetical protein
VSLENLLRIGQLKTHPVGAEEIERLLQAAQRNLRDAQVTGISTETRFDAAYEGITQSALAALMLHGYRPDTNHMTVVQSVSLTIGVEAKRICRTGCVASSTQYRRLHWRRYRPVHSRTLRRRSTTIDR